uniref:Putative secreted protein n=1 Tax=Anopheles darlingi TaxID=43151 RepID=A0A2M4D5Z5_ANODA
MRRVRSSPPQPAFTFLSAPFVSPSPGSAYFGVNRIRKNTQRRNAPDTSSSYRRRGRRPRCRPFCRRLSQGQGQMM